jgi:anti-sigma B factor antagonist
MNQLVIERTPSVAIPDVTIFHLKGPLTLSTMFAFQEALRDSSLQGTIIDLAGVDYIDSAGLGVLLSQFARAQRNSFKYALTALSPRVLTIFQITHIDNTVPIFATAADAESSFVTQKS